MSMMVCLGASWGRSAASAKTSSAVRYSRRTRAPACFFFHSRTSTAASLACTQAWTDGLAAAQVPLRQPSTQAADLRPSRCACVQTGFPRQCSRTDSYKSAGSESALLLRRESRSGRLAANAQGRMMHLLHRLFLGLLLGFEQLVLLVVVEAHAHALRPQLRLYRLVDALPVAPKALTCMPTRLQIASANARTKPTSGACAPPAALLSRIESLRSWTAGPVLLELSALLAEYGKSLAVSLVGNQQEWLLSDRQAVYLACSPCQPAAWHRCPWCASQSRPDRCLAAQLQTPSSGPSALLSAPFSSSLLPASRCAGRGKMSSGVINAVLLHTGCACLFGQQREPHNAQWSAGMRSLGCVKDLTSCQKRSASQYRHPHRLPGP